MSGESRDRLMDALLALHLGETPARMERRYGDAFATLDAGTTPSRSRALRLARAALVALCAGTLLLLLPVESSASTVLANAASSESRAAAGDGDRRYEIEVRFSRPGPGVDRSIVLAGHWDMRGDESRLEIAPDGFPALVRVDSKAGAWERRGDGPARALDSRELWPRWIEDREGRIAVERMDDLLRLVQRSYEVAFARAGGESPGHLRGALHLVASRRERAPGPDEIDLWIDTGRNVVLEATLRWKRPPRDGRPPRPPAMEDDYRVAPGALPPLPPAELRLRRIEPIAFPADHFTMPTPTAATSAAAPSAGSTAR